MADLFEGSIVPGRILELLLAWTKVHYQDKMPEMFREKYLDHLKKYFIIGGMPAAVSVWMDTKDFSEVTKVQRRLLRSYENDFSKHAPAATVPKIHHIWNSIPFQLASTPVCFFAFFQIKISCFLIFDTHQHTVMRPT